MKYRSVAFKIDVLGVDTWRWSILPDQTPGLTLVGQVRGTRDQAETYCRSEINALLERAVLRPARLGSSATY
jgi:hypothetical protein